MIDFLKEYGISENTINNIKENNSESTLFDLTCNKDNCIRILNYMRELGINISNVDNILIYRIDIFFLDFEEFVKKIAKCNIPILINLINDNYNNIDIINNI